VDKYTVTFDSHDGSAVAPITDIAKNATITLPAAPTRDGYTFVGWFTEENGGTEFTNLTPVTDNITVYAKWSEVPVQHPYATRAQVAEFIEPEGATLTFISTNPEIVRVNP